MHKLSLKKIILKKISVTFLVCLITGFAFAQADSTKPIYLRFPTVPQFTIYKAADSTAFTRDSLQKKTSTVFIIFSPECEHCQRETDSLIKHIDLFKNAQIVMTTYLAYEEMVKFYKDYKIANYPNIIMGRDAKFFFPVFFKIQSLPAIYIYDKKGKFKNSYQGSVDMKTLAEQL